MASNPSVPAVARERRAVVYPCQLVVLVDTETDAAVREIVKLRRTKRQADATIAAVLREMVVEGVAAERRKADRAAKGRAYASGKGKAAA